MSVIIIINPKVKPSANAVINTSDSSVAVINPNGDICAHGFPSEEFAHGWLYAMTHHCKE